ncbi:metal-dependent hydrolase [Halomarina rubra]|uniref:Metal-dependent hydrolase n=1 Tax=Halomarina rubra TaxID=2071873 RepID=A0ABD6B1B9_9EURY|nr:metal-dependent hydrolase [Halomarina rubra]
MWPWEHLAVGYLVVALALRFGWHRSPDAWTAVAVAVGTQFADLVDKPLAWQFGVLESGTSVAHSIFVAVPLSVLIVAVAWYFDRTVVGAAFAVGYLLHLPADAMYGAVYGSGMDFGKLLWPVVTGPSSDYGSFFENFAFYLERLGRVLDSPRGLAIIAFEVTLLGSAFVVWVADGLPGIPRIGRPRGRNVRRVEHR